MLSSCKNRRCLTFCRRLKASAAFPENTLASFTRAIADGADGIESGISALFENFAFDVLKADYSWQTFIYRSTVSSSCSTILG